MLVSKIFNKIISFSIILTLGGLAAACTAGGGGLGNLPIEDFETGQALDAGAAENAGEEEALEATPERPATFTELAPVEKRKTGTLPEETLPGEWFQSSRGDQQELVFEKLPTGRLLPLEVYEIQPREEEPLEMRSFDEPCWDCLDSEQE